jgi:hypothetical protein
MHKKIGYMSSNAKFVQRGNVYLVMYTNNDRIGLVDNEGTPLTRNITDEPMGKTEVAVRDYSECEGVLNALVDSKIVSKPKRFVRSGFVDFPICEVIVPV